jgi:hypothetical protein
MPTHYYFNDETSITPYSHPYIPNRLQAPKILSHWPTQLKTTLLDIYNLYCTITSVIENQWALEAGPAHQVRPGTVEADVAAQGILKVVEEMQKSPRSVGLARLTDLPQVMVDQVVEAQGVAKRYLLLRG